MTDGGELPYEPPAYPDRISPIIEAINNALRDMDRQPLSIAHTIRAAIGKTLGDLDLADKAADLARGIVRVNTEDRAVHHGIAVAIHTDRCRMLGCDMDAGVADEDAARIALDYLRTHQ